MGCMPARAADELVLQLDGLALPIDLVALESWTRRPQQAGNDLKAWLNLLEPQSRRDLVRLLQAPLLRDRSFGLQLLNSWTGEQMLKEAGSLLTTGAADRSTAPLLLSSLRRLLERQSSVSALELLRALPVASVTLSLDGAVQLAGQWRSQLQRQNTA
ncbi:MAG: alpha/beta hydrolase, partial [Cyanobium sp. MAG_160]|nr:alpha/beta hydrolase [Cyanobium sp. MAG_160]